MDEDILGLWIDEVGIRVCPCGTQPWVFEKKSQHFLKALHSLPVFKLTPLLHPVSSASVTTERGDKEQCWTNLPSVHTQQISKCIHSS